MADVVELSPCNFSEQRQPRTPMLTLLLIAAVVIVGFGVFAWAYD
jgi:hypothetical protein